MVILAKQVNAEEKILPDTSFSIHHRKNNCVIAHGSKEMYELFPVDLNLLTKSNLRLVFFIFTQSVYEIVQAYCF